VVWLDDITSGKAFNFPEPRMDQKHCEFVPHVLLIQPGAMKLLNTDLCSHNVHIFSSANREVNQSSPAHTSPVEITLMRPDQATIRCDIHKWMQGYVFVAKNPYSALSGAGGVYTLTDQRPAPRPLRDAAGLGLARSFEANHTVVGAAAFYALRRSVSTFSTVIR
jgi:hypothetical protein